MYLLSIISDGPIIIYKLHTTKISTYRNAGFCWRPFQVSSAAEKTDMIANRFVNEKKEQNEERSNTFHPVISPVVIDVWRLDSQYKQKDYSRIEVIDIINTWMQAWKICKYTLWFKAMALRGPLPDQLLSPLPFP